MEVGASTTRLILHGPWIIRRKVSLNVHLELVTRGQFPLLSGSHQTMEFLPQVGSMEFCAFGMQTIRNNLWTRTTARNRFIDIIPIQFLGTL